MSAEKTMDGCAVICPHCGYRHQDSWEWCSEDGENHECHHCDKPFRCWAVRSTTYHAEPVEAAS